jgi:glycosyltransferase involved in cell wall biosynthesis
MEKAYPIRVLHVVTIMNRAGIETMLMNLYRSMDRRLIQFDFLVHREEKGDYDDEIIQMGGRIYIVPSISPFHHKKYLKRLDSFFSSTDYRIVHSHLNTFSMYVLRSAKNIGISCRIAHSHIDRIPIDYKYPFKLFCKKKLRFYLTERFACGEGAGNWLFDTEKFRVVNNAIDTKRFLFTYQDKNIFKQKFNVKDQFVIGHIGRFSKQKNHHFIVDIFIEILKIRPQSMLLLIGDGALQKSIRKRVYRLNLSEKILFLGVRTDIPELLSVMDCFIFPSLFEGLGVVAIEAQCSGLHTFVSDAIPKEAFITEHIHKITLKESALQWANFIIKNSTIPINQEQSIRKIVENGYDVSETAQWLQKFYLERYER